MTATIEVARVPATSTRGGRRVRGEARAAWGMLAPAAALYLVFVAIPLVAALVLTLFRWDLITEPEFVGLENFRRLLDDPTIVRSVVNTVYFAVVTVVLHLVGGLALALALNRPMGNLLRRLVSTAFFFPVMLSWASVALIWRYALDPNFGFVNHYLRQLGLNPPNWFVQPGSAMPALIGIDLWHSLGYTMVILLAGLQTIPRVYYEAARIDGAGAWRQLVSITLPLLSPTLLFASVVSFIGAFQIFEPMFIITQGGPEKSTLSVVQDVYYSAFRDFNMGYASTKSLVIVVAILAVTGLQLVLARRWVSYDR